MSLKNVIFVTLSFLIYYSGTAQRNFDQNNHIGITGGIGFHDITTDNFETESGNGFILGFTTRGKFYESIDLIYGVSFIQSEIGILANNPGDPTNNFQSQYVNYKMQGAQINFLGSFNIIRNHLSIEAGPILNVNGKMKLDTEDFEDFIVAGYDTLTSSDLENVSRIHFVLATGITAGIENFRVGAMYQYGVTNQFNRYNDTEGFEKPADGKFEGHTSTILLTATLYL